MVEGYLYHFLRCKYNYEVFTVKKFNLSKVSSKNVAFTCIISIFSILLLQSTLSLFVGMLYEELSQIDIVFRTSISSIFGYLMSMVSTGDFVIKSKHNIITTTQPIIGFKADGKSDIITSQAEKEEVKAQIIPNPIKEQLVDSKKKTLAVNVQIIVLTIVCVFCLAVMLVVRNFSELIVINASNNVTISLFRDIISGSVGALIGLSRSND